MEAKLFEHIVDALDLETFILCESEEEGKRIMLDYMAHIGLTDTDIVFIEHIGLGARVRSRGYVYRPGDNYPWLNSPDRGDKNDK